MAFHSDRNPSPPPEILKNENLVPDRVGRSVYSKQWVYKTLMAVIEVIKSTADKPGNSDNSAEKNNDMIELDPKVEADACTLWDMAANPEVSDFLYDCGAANIFLDVVDCTKSPRLLEIVIGILGNMASFDAVCQKLSKNKQVVFSAIMLSGTSDTPTLLQVFRLIQCGVANKNSQHFWFDAFEEHPFFLENIKFIFKNCLNGEVLQDAYQLLDTILRQNLVYCYPWGQQAHLTAIVEGGKQLLKCQQNLDTFFGLLHTLCYYPPNVKLCAKHFKELNQLFFAFFMNLGDEEALPEASRITIINLTFEMYSRLLQCPGLDREMVSTDIDVLKAIYKVSSHVNCLISDVKRENVRAMTFMDEEDQAGPRILRRTEYRNGRPYITMMTEENFNLWMVLSRAINHTAVCLSQYIEKDDEKEVLDDIFASKVPEENIGILII